MSSTLILNGTLVNEGTQTQQDIFIQNGRIEKIAPDLGHQHADTIIDAGGKMVMPGMIDDQVHFREPGLTHKADIKTESAAAVAGGITSFMEMPNTTPTTDCAQALQDKYSRAGTKSLANFAFYMGATNYNTEAIKSLDPNLACGVKIFMGSSTGDLVVSDEKALEAAFANSPILVATHCEDDPIINANLAKALAQYGDDIPLEQHPAIRSREACIKSSTKAMKLAKQYGTKLHILHITTADECAMFESGNIEDKQITAEACAHHLFFNETDYAKLGNLIKCNPAIKAKADQEAILQAVLDDKIDIIATDHAPHTWDEKHQLYTKAPAGLPLVQHALLSLFEHYHRGLFSLELIVNKTSHAVAKRFQIKDRGFLREGYWADITIVDLKQQQLITNDTVLYKCGWTPFEGMTFGSTITHTLVNGELVYSDGEVHRAGLGVKLDFER
jgi:dihydroorotase